MTALAGLASTVRIHITVYSPWPGFGPRGADNGKPKAKTERGILDGVRPEVSAPQNRFPVMLCQGRPRKLNLLRRLKAAKVGGVDVLQPKRKLRHLVDGLKALQTRPVGRETS